MRVDDEDVEASTRSHVVVDGGRSRSRRPCRRSRREPMAGTLPPVRRLVDPRSAPTRSSHRPSSARGRSCRPPARTASSSPRQTTYAFPKPGVPAWRLTAMSGSAVADAERGTVSGSLTPLEVSSATTTASPQLRSAVARADHGEARAAIASLCSCTATNSVNRSSEGSVRQDVDLVADRLVVRSRVGDHAGGLPARAAVRRAREPHRPAEGLRVDEALDDSPSTCCSARRAGPTRRTRSCESNGSAVIDSLSLKAQLESRWPESRINVVGSLQSRRRPSTC